MSAAFANSPWLELVRTDIWGCVYPRIYWLCTGDLRELFIVPKTVKRLRLFASSKPRSDTYKTTYITGRAISSPSPRTASGRAPENRNVRISGIGDRLVYSSTADWVEEQNKQGRYHFGIELGGSMSVFTIELRKHTATISWQGSPRDLFGVPAGSLTVYTEDPLSSTRDARDAAELNLYRLKQILNNLNGMSDYCTVIDNRPIGK